MSKRAGRIVQAEIRAMSVECEKMNGINLAQGVCDTELPVPVLAGAIRGLEAGVNSYTRFDGIEKLRSEIAKKVYSYNRMTVDPETEITVSAGTTGAFYCACLALLDPGDEVILFEPFYGYHVNTLFAVEAIPSFVKLNLPDWKFNADDLERAVTPRTKGIMVNTPGNPTGKVFTAQELEWIADFAVRHNLLVFTDEIYEYFVYDGRQHVSPGYLSKIADRTITIGGFSKTFSITGWRVGYSIAREEYARMIGYINDLVYVCAPAPLQYGVAVGLSQLAPEFYANIAQEYQLKRDQLCDALTTAGLTAFVPEGAYYVLADCSILPGLSSKEKAMHLLRQTGVAGVPGESFIRGHEGTNLIRFCFAKDSKPLEEACERLQGLKLSCKVAALQNSANS